MTVEITWTCNICGDERPDANIGVARASTVIARTGAFVGVNVRFCNDRPECTAAAQHEADTRLGRITGGQR